jgi:hypothetical protein
MKQKTIDYMDEAASAVKLGYLRRAAGQGELKNGETLIGGGA